MAPGIRGLNATARGVNGCKRKEGHILRSSDSDDISAVWTSFFLTFLTVLLLFHHHRHRRCRHLDHQIAEVVGKRSVCISNFKLKPSLESARMWLRMFGCSFVYMRGVCICVGKGLFLNLCVCGEWVWYIFKKKRFYLYARACWASLPHSSNVTGHRPNLQNCNNFMSSAYKTMILSPWCLQYLINTVNNKWFTMIYCRSRT